MPWKPSQAHAKTHKANTPKKKRQWAHIADKLMAEGKSEAQAIREASGVVAKRMYGKKR
jgi:hypothetical protein